jgi:hypothetical protein
LADVRYRVGHCPSASQPRPKSAPSSRHNMAPGFICTGVRDPRGPHRRRSRQWRADGVLPIPIAVDVGEGGERLFKASDALDTWPSCRPAGTWYETLPVRVTLSRGAKATMSAHETVHGQLCSTAALAASITSKPQVRGRAGLRPCGHGARPRRRAGGPAVLRPWIAASRGGRAGGLTAGQVCGLTAIARGGLTAKDPRFGGGEEKMTWHGGTHELGRRMGKLLEQIVF